MITHHRQSFLNHAVVLFIMTLLCTTIGSTLAACSSCLLTLPISATHQLLLQQQHQSRSRSQLSAHNKNHRHYHSSYVTTDTMWGRHRHMHMHRHQNYQHHIMKSILLIASRGIIFRTLEQHVLPVLSKHLDATATYMKKSDSDSDSDRAADDNTMIPPPDFLKKGPKTLEKDGDDKEKTGTSEKEEDKDAVVSSMVLTIGFYKNFISPLLPPGAYSYSLFVLVIIFHFFIQQLSHFFFIIHLHK